MAIRLSAFVLQTRKPPVISLRKGNLTFSHFLAAPTSKSFVNTAPLHRNSSFHSWLSPNVKSGEAEGKPSTDEILFDEQILQQELDKAIKDEDYAHAAKLRDNLQVIHEDSKASVLSANARFYHAFRNGDLAAMQAVCTDSTMSSSSATLPLPSISNISKPSILPKAARTSLSMSSSKALLKQVGIGLASTAITALLTTNALAFDVLLGASDGSLAFVPNEFSVNAGEQIVFRNNAGFPHNVVFDEEEVPPGVVASTISMNEEDLLNAPGETYSVALTAKGTYTFYCSPHQGAGMVGKVTVN